MSVEIGEGYIELFDGQHGLQYGDEVSFGGLTEWQPLKERLHRLDFLLQNRYRRKETNNISHKIDLILHESKLIRKELAALNDLLTELLDPHRIVSGSLSFVLAPAPVCPYCGSQDDITSLSNFWRNDGSPNGFYCQSCVRGFTLITSSLQDGAIGGTHMQTLNIITGKSYRLTGVHFDGLDAAGTAVSGDIPDSGATFTSQAPGTSVITHNPDGSWGLVAGAAGETLQIDVAADFEGFAATGSGSGVISDTPVSGGLIFQVNPA